MRATTIRVRVNPADDDEYVIFADAEDRNGQHWLGQRSGGRWTGWEWTADVADWPEYELTIPVVSDPRPTARQQCAGDRVGRTGNDPERAMRQPQ